MALKYFRRRFQYYLNDILVRNPLWQILFLVVMSAAVITAGMILVDGHFSDEYSENTFWWSFTRLLDQGTFIGDNRYDTHTAAVGVFVTISGIMILSLLIGILSSKITERLESLKKGRSPIVEKDHLIVCGGGDRLYEVVRELIESRRELPRGDRKSIVMFSGSTREEMEDTLSQRTGRRVIPEVICRSGNTTDIDSLRLAGFDTCRGFVVVGEDDGAVLKTLIAVRALCDRMPQGAVCEIQNRKLGQVANIVSEDVRWVPSRDVIMRLLVQICRQPGLSAVYKEILSFAGNEFYIREWPFLEGSSFDGIAKRCRGGVVAGIQKGGRVILNPSSETVYRPGDRLLVLAETPRSYSFIDEQLETDSLKVKPKQVCGGLFRMLVFSGHSTRFDLMLDLLDRYSSGGAEILVAGNLPVEEGRRVTGLIQCTKCTVDYKMVDRTDPVQVEALNPWNYHSIMVLSGKPPGETDEAADSHCIVTLLILKGIKDSHREDWKGTTVAEIRNPRNRRLASAAEIDDFVISNEVCSMIMAQLVKQNELGQVFEEIFDPSGCEIQLRCSDQFFPGTFADIQAQGRLRGETVLGWLTGRGSAAVVELNPPSREMMPKDEDCRIVAIAER